MPIPNQWFAWFNGKIMPEQDVRVPFRDRGFLYGDAVFDTTRTFNHRLFKVKEHVDRLYKSLAYVRMDPGISPKEFIDASEEVAALNLKHMPKNEDIWVTQRVSRGLDEYAREMWPDYRSPMVMVECRVLPFRERARFFRDGLPVVIPSIRRPGPDVLSPRAKANQYLNFILADLEAKSMQPDAVSVLLDTNGNLAEGRGNNIFIVKDGTLYTPKEQFVLPGISRATAMMLAQGLKIPVVEKDLDVYDAMTADEAFLTSTSWCICPISTVNGAKIGRFGDGKIPGPVTKKLTDAYVKLVDFDWVGQYLRYLN
ncbi:MAG: hypothetical protein EXQ86_04740 [Rhodospirillales bacterium]|nr:hypothetical protein [Rhodospirillales bacterium]